MQENTERSEYNNICYDTKWNVKLRVTTYSVVFITYNVNENSNKLYYGLNL